MSILPYGGGEGVIMTLYANDILIFGTRLNVIKEVKDFLFKKFCHDGFG